MLGYPILSGGRLGAPSSKGAGWVPHPQVGARWVLIVPHPQRVHAGCPILSGC